MSESIRNEYETNGYSVVRAAAPKGVAETLLAVICAQMNSKPEALKQFLSTPRVNVMPAYEFYSYRHPAVMGFHWGMTGQMAALTGKRLAPTYAFFRVYQAGDTCTVHSDREACEHSLSMLLGYSDGIVWPFEIGARSYEFDIARDMPKATDFGGDPTHEVMLEAGDGILYHGCNYRHGRTMPNPNRWSAHIFLHWVDLDGPFKEWAFDRNAFPPIGDFKFPDSRPQ